MTSLSKVATGKKLASKELTKWSMKCEEIWSSMCTKITVVGLDVF